MLHSCDLNIQRLPNFRKKILPQISCNSVPQWQPADFWGQTCPRSFRLFLFCLLAQNLHLQTLWWSPVLSCNVQAYLMCRNDDNKALPTCHTKSQKSNSMNTGIILTTQYTEKSKNTHYTTVESLIFHTGIFWLLSGVDSTLWVFHTEEVINTK